MSCPPRLVKQNLKGGKLIRKVKAQAEEQINCPTCRQVVYKANPLVHAQTIDGVVAKWVESMDSRREGWDGMIEWEERNESVFSYIF